MAYFNLAEGRFRQSNLHLARPVRLTNRTYIEEMYEHRHQKEFGNIVSLAWRLLRSEQGGLRVVAYYCLMHLAGVTNRHGWRRLANSIRRWIPIGRVEQAVSTLLRTRYRFVVTDLGGCAVDVDNEHDYDVTQLRFEKWREAQAEKAERLYGPLALPPGARDSKVEES